MTGKTSSAGFSNGLFTSFSMSEPDGLRFPFCGCHLADGGRGPRMICVHLWDLDPGPSLSNHQSAQKDTVETSRCEIIKTRVWAEMAWLRSSVVKTARCAQCVGGGGGWWWRKAEAVANRAFHLKALLKQLRCGTHCGCKCSFCAIVRDEDTTDTGQEPTMMYCSLQARIDTDKTFF